LLDEMHATNPWLCTRIALGHLQRIENGEVVIAFPADHPTARTEVEKQENRRVLERILVHLLGRPVTLRIVAVSGGSPRRREEEALAADPMIQEAVQKLDGQIISQE